ncbi:MAG: N-6 DNA methylase [Rhodocyclaceae bacterium]|nr:N-6 DNA methylase [Rhodocyclaceae bacterium]
MMLNGSRGNFCLQAEGDPEDDPRSIAWSSDVGHFVHIGQQVVVRSWHETPFPQSYSARDVVDRLKNFHEYLERSEPNRDASIISHASRVLRQLRYGLPERLSPEESIDQFLVLIAAAVDGCLPRQIDANRWRLSTQALGASSILRDSEWEVLVKELTAWRPSTGLQPLIKLLLRHASGLLFQEVHYGVQTPLNLQLPGIAPPPIKVVGSQVGKTSGVHFTPPYLARTLVEQALHALGPQLPDKLVAFDPACGSSEFFKELIRQLALKRFKGKLEIIGWDISPVAASISEFTLGFEQMNGIPFEVSVTIQARDSLSSAAGDWPTNVSIALMNPPFAGWNFLSENQKEQLRTIYGDRFRPNMAAAFLLRAADCVREGGVLASVVPASVTDTETSQSVRDYLASQFTPTLLAKLGNQTLFSNAIVDIGLYVGVRRIDPSRPTRVLWADQRAESLFSALRMLRISTVSGLNAEAVDGRAYSIYPSYSVAREGGSWMAHSLRSVSLLNQCENLPRAGSLFRIRQGVRLGGDVFLQPADYVRSLSDDEQRFFRRAVANESIRAGRLCDVAYVWYPYVDGKPAICSEEDLRTLAPRYFKEKLSGAREKLAASKSRQREGLPWWQLIWPRPDLATTKKIVSKYFGVAGAFAFDAVGEFVPVVSHAWVPKPALAGLEDTAFHAYIAILSSPLCDELLRSVSVHIGGGQLNLEAKYMDHFPIPSFGHKRGEHSLTLISQLAEIGMSLAAGEPIDMSLLDQLAREAYRLK